MDLPDQRTSSLCGRALSTFWLDAWAVVPSLLAKASGRVRSLFRMAATSSKACRKRRHAERVAVPRASNPIRRKLLRWRRELEQERDVNEREKSGRDGHVVVHGLLGVALHSRCCRVRYCGCAG